MGRFVLLFVVFCLFLFSLAYAPTSSVPDYINYQGMLTDDMGVALNGNYNIGFRLYNVSTGGSPIYTHTFNNWPVVNGLFTVQLHFGPSHFNGSDRWVGITVGTDPELTPRTKFTSLPYAYRSLVADTAYVAAPGSDMDERYVNVAGPDSITGNGTGDVFRIRNYGNGDALAIRAVGGTSADGIYIDTVGDNGIEIYNTGTHGIRIEDTGDDAIYITDAGDMGIYIYNTVDDGIYVSNPGDYGIYVNNSADDGIYVSSPGGEGVKVYGAEGLGAFNATQPDTHGVYIYQAGRYGIYIDSTYVDGIYMDDCGDDGVQIYHADDDGIYVVEAGGYGIWAHGNTGNLLESENSGYYGLNVYSYAASSSNPGLKVWGTFVATGSKATVVQTSQGEERLYCMETPDVEFMASGSASLVSGQAQITFERLFQEAISSDIPVKVIVTPTSECNGIFVNSKSSTGFTVKELMSGTSNAEFDWMAIGRREGYEQRPAVQVADIEQIGGVDQEEAEPKDVYYPQDDPPPEEEIEKKEVEPEENRQ